MAAALAVTWLERIDSADLTKVVGSRLGITKEEAVIRVLKMAEDVIRTVE
jgi:hypothetical protein